MKHASFLKIFLPFAQESGEANGGSIMPFSRGRQNDP
jgi:hypothetical protein